MSRSEIKPKIFKGDQTPNNQNEKTNARQFFVLLITVDIKY